MNRALAALLSRRSWVSTHGPAGTAGYRGKDPGKPRDGKGKRGKSGRPGALFECVISGQPLIGWDLVIKFHKIR